MTRVQQSILEAKIALRREKPEEIKREVIRALEMLATTKKGEHNADH